MKVDLLATTRGASFARPMHDRRLRAVFARAACAALLTVVGANALSLPGRRLVGRYDFGYAIRGDGRARPAQVFDDGAGKIYFEPRPGRAMPAVFVGQPAQLQLLVLQPEGQYFTARTGASDFTLALGAARASVRRGDAALGGETLEPEATPALPPPNPATSMETGGGDAEPPPSDAESPAFRTMAAPWIDHRLVHAQPIVFAAGSAVPSPQVRAALSALVVRIGRGVAVVVEGRGDAGTHDALAHSRALALRRALLASGLAANDVEVRDGDDPATPSTAASTIRWTTTAPRDLAPLPAPTAASPVFDIDPADRDIAGTLRRWARSTDYDVVWDVHWTAPVNGAMRLAAPTFVDAAKAVAEGLRAQGYPVQAQAYADRVVRFAAID